MRNNWLNHFGDFAYVSKGNWKKCYMKDSQRVLYLERLKKGAISFITRFPISRLMVCYTLRKTSTSTSVKLKFYLVTALKL